MSRGDRKAFHRDERRGQAILAAPIEPGQNPVVVENQPRPNVPASLGVLVLMRIFGYDVVPIVLPVPGCRDKAARFCVRSVALEIIFEDSNPVRPNALERFFRQNAGARVNEIEKSQHYCI